MPASAGMTVSGAGMTKDGNVQFCTSLCTPGALDHGTSGALNLEQVLREQGLIVQSAPTPMGA